MTNSSKKDALPKSEYWKQISEHWSSERSDQLWRRHSDILNSALLRRWANNQRVKTLLKTDLFDELHGEGLMPLLQTYGNSTFGMDIADTALRSSRSNHSTWLAVKADVRQLPFENETLDIIVSNSTIDHFRTMNELVSCISEFSRTLKPSGQLWLTVDNLVNPVVFVRNHLPFKILNRLGLVPYYVGKTCGPNSLKKLISKNGLVVQEVTAIEHCPRILAVVLSRIVSKYFSPRTEKKF